MNSETIIRGATLDDAEKIFAMIDLNDDLLVSRSMGNIVSNIDRFIVAQSDGEMVGIATFQIHPEIGAPENATVEIQSLAVKSAFRTRGIGRALVETIASKVKCFKPREIVVLTFTPEFFEKLGFHEVPKTKIMHKLYTGCMNCTKHTDPYTCPEIAMTRATF